MIGVGAIATKTSRAMIRRLAANSARRFVMHAGKKPNSRRSSYATFAVRSVIATGLARVFFAALRIR
jgi:hypothetical protein